MSVVADLHGIKNLGYATDLIFPLHEGRIEDHGDYLCVRTPSNPSYMWGNFVLFRRAPTLADANRWAEIYDRHYGPDNWFRTIGWDEGLIDDATRAAFEARGFAFENARIFRATRPAPPARPAADLEVRVLDEAGWERALWHHVRFLCHGEFAAAQRRFEERRFQAYRRLRDLNLGQWFGAFSGDELVGDMGLFVYQGRARFQEVLVHPDHRRRGVCRTLCERACAIAVERFGAREFVTLANEPDAISAYRGIGFEDVGEAQGLRWCDLTRATGL